MPAIFLLIVFSLTQSIPAGWSADPVTTNDQGIIQPVVAINEDQTAEVQEEKPAGPETSVTFLEKDLPLKPIDPPQVCLTCCGPPPCCGTCGIDFDNIKPISSDLARNFGFSEENIERWMKEGLIRIEVSQDQRTATVHLDPSIQLKGIENRTGILVDPLGLGKMPEVIEYRWKERLSDEMELGGGFFYVDGLGYEFTYDKNRLSSVQISEGPPPCEGELCSKRPPILIKQITYSYEEDGHQITARIGTGLIPSAAVTFKKMADGQYHLQTVEEYDREGKLLAKSEFQYLTAWMDAPCLPGPGQSCPPSDITVHLSKITRTDSEGNLLSTISNFQNDVFKVTRDEYDMPVMFGGFIGAQITLPDGTVKLVEFKTLEELFLEARKLENQTPEAPPLQKLLTEDLARNFGFSKENIERWMKEGLIRIEVSQDQRTATVHLDPSIQLKGIENRTGILVDPLGLGKLPIKIVYQYQQEEKVVQCIRAPCPPLTETTLVSALFTVGDRDYQLSYDSGELPELPITELVLSNRGRLSQVTIFQHDPRMLCGAGLPCGRIVEKLSFRYEEKGAIQVTVRYPDTSKETLGSREIFLEKMADGQYHLQTVEEYDRDGKLLAKSEFGYLEVAPLCMMGTDCPPVIVRLELITRTDSEGKPLSEIRDFQELKEQELKEGKLRYAATVVLADGREEKVLFDTLENLLLEARKLENQTPEAPPLQKLLTEDLARNFGFSKENIERWMKEGLIKIEVSQDQRTATVHLDPSIQLKGIENRTGILVDPLGLGKLPSEINYKFYETQFMCMGPGCLPTGVYLSSANFQIGSRSYELRYKSVWIEGTLHEFHKNLLSSVTVYDGQGEKIMSAEYEYDLRNSYVLKAVIKLPETGEPQDLLRARDSIKINITYHKPEGPVSRTVVLEKMEDSQYHIRSVEDYDREGKLLAKSEFKYEVSVSSLLKLCPQGENCRPPVTLVSITRTDSEGKPLSEIRDFQELKEGKLRYAATVVLADSREEKVLFDTLEELFLEARKLEGKGRFSDLPAGTLEAVAQELGIDVGDIIDIRYVDSSEVEKPCVGPFCPIYVMPCLGPRCPTYGYLDLKAKVGGAILHFVGTLRGWGSLPIIDPPIIAVPFPHPELLPVTFPLEKDSRVMDPQEIFKDEVDLKVMPPYPWRTPLPEVYLIETELPVVEAAIAIAAELKTTLEKITSIGFEPMLVCEAIGCPLWAGSFSVTLENEEYFKGQIESYQGEEKIQYKIEFTPPYPQPIREFVDHLRKSLGDAYLIEVRRSLIAIYPPIFNVHIRARGDSNSRRSQVDVGELESVSLSFSGDKFQPESFTVQYGEMPALEGEMLFRGLQILASSPDEEPWAPIILMAQITVTGVDQNGMIHFSYQGEDWRIYRDKEGKVILETEREFLQRALLDKANKEMNEALQQAVDLQRMLEEARKTLKEEITNLDSEISSSVESLKSLLTELKEMLDRDGLTEKTQQTIKDFLEAMKGYLDKGLAQERDDYVRALTLDRLSPIKTVLRTWRRYLTDLRDYAHKVETAESLAELEELAKNFPVKLEADPPPILLPVPPTQTLKRHIEGGTALLEKAKREAVSPAVQKFLDRLRELSGYRVRVKQLKTPPFHIPISRTTRYQIWIVPQKDGSTRSSDGMPAIILPGQLHSMDFELSVEEWLIDDRTEIMIHPETIHANYEEMPEVEGSLLYEGIRQLASRSGIEGDPDPAEVISLITKILLKAVDQDGTIHFNHKGEDWRIYQDKEGKVILEKEPREREIKPTPKEQRLLNRLGKVIAFETLTATTENRAVTLHYQFNAKGPGKAELVFTVDPCRGNKFCRAPIFTATLVVNIPEIWILSSDLPVKKTREVNLRPGKQEVTLRIGNGLQINLPGTLKAGNLIRASERPAPRKPPVITPRPKPLPPIVSPWQKSGSVTSVDPKKKKKKNRR